GRLAGVLFAFFRVLVPLAGLALLLFVLLLVSMGLPARPDILPLAAALTFALLLMASLFLQRGFWRPFTLVLTGLVLLVLVGFWIFQGGEDRIQHHLIFSLRR